MARTSCASAAAGSAAASTVAKTISAQRRIFAAAPWPPYGEVARLPRTNCPILDSNLRTPAFRLLRDEDAHDLDGAPGHDPPAPPPRDGSGSGQLPHAWGAQFWPAQGSFAAVDLRDGQGRAPPPPPAQPAQHARHRRESARPGTRSVPQARGVARRGRQILLSEVPIALWQAARLADEDAAREEYSPRPGEQAPPTFAKSAPEKRDQRMSPTQYLGALKRCGAELETLVSSLPPQQCLRRNLTAWVKDGHWANVTVECKLCPTS
jgi:hypothetical protein